jgi:hypothetical protein
VPLFEQYFVKRTYQKQNGFKKRNSISPILEIFKGQQNINFLDFLYLPKDPLLLYKNTKLLMNAIKYVQRKNYRTIISPAGSMEI